MVKLLNAIKSWFAECDRNDLDCYLSKSQNHADLKERMRRWHSNRNNLFG
jgi:hypothetical protein